MTQDEWLASEDPAAMLRALPTIMAPDGEQTPDGLGVSDRKLRLWVFACREAEQAARTITVRWHDAELTDPGELLACAHNWAAGTDARSVVPMPLRAALLRDIVGNPWRPAAYRRETRKEGVVLVEVHGGVWPDGKPYTETQGVPWLTSTVLALAEAVYHVRCRGCERCYGGWIAGECIRPCPNVTDGSLDPDRLAVLADALEEAGVLLEWCPGCNGRPRRTRAEHFICVDHDAVVETHPLLAHLRGPGPHWRGCWALDLILGKA